LEITQTVEFVGNCDGNDFSIIITAWESGEQIAMFAPIPERTMREYGRPFRESR